MKKRFMMILLSVSYLMSFSASSKTFLVKFDGLVLKAGERIVGFDITLKSGAFSIRKFFHGWDLDVGNDPSGRAEVSGSIYVGAAAINLADLNNGLAIQVPDGASAVSLGGDIMVSEDFSSVRHVHVTPQNYHVVEMP